MNKVREKAAEKTKAARRDMERRRHHQRITPLKLLMILRLLINK
jgi:hypothetical protein